MSVKLMINARKIGMIEKINNQITAGAMKK